MTKTQHTRAVLIVEDDIDIQNFLTRVMELEGYAVFQTVDGAGALELIRHEDISLMLLDLRLPPGPDGWSVLREIKRDPKLAGIPVVVLTASAGIAQRRRTLRMGADSYLVKPVSARRLVEAVREALKRKVKNTRAGRTTLSRQPTQSS